MTDDPIDLPGAELRAAAARKRLTRTLVDIQARLNPKVLAREAIEELRETTGDLAREGVAAAKRHPLSVAGALAAIGVLATRRPLRRLLTRNRDATSTGETS